MHTRSMWHTEGSDPMTAQIRQEIMKLVHQYGSGRDTLRCLALGTIDEPVRKEAMKLEDATHFIDYEVCRLSSTLSQIMVLLSF